MKLPIKEKYIDESIGVWAIFGESPGGVDITDGVSDIFSGVPLREAREAVLAHDRFRRELYRILGKKTEVPSGQRNPIKSVKGQ